MTDVTDLGEIVVTGQRRRSGGSFPTRGATGGGGVATGVPGMNEIEPEDTESPNEPGQDPCADPAAALEWNADAASAEAAKEFAKRATEAGETRFETRERGAFLYLDSDGTVKLGPIHTGDPFDAQGRGQVQLTYVGIPDPLSIIGAIHSHPRGDYLPSDGDYAAWQAVLANLSARQRDPNLAREYVTTWQPDGQPMIHVYDHRNIKPYDPSNPKGPEVNPEAQPCP